MRRGMSKADAEKEKVYVRFKSEADSPLLGAAPASKLAVDLPPRLPLVPPSTPNAIIGRGRAARA